MTAQRNVLLLLANGFEIFEASAFIDVMGWNRLEGDGSTIVTICGFQKEIKSTFGVTLVADILVDDLDIDSYDALAIPGGFGEFHFYDQAYSDRFADVIKGFDERNKTIASICTGALPIGNSGVLKSRNGTTYNKNRVRQKELRDFGVTVLDEPVVIDDNIITSWNPSTALDVAFSLLEKLTSKEQSDTIRNLMGCSSNEE
ncbi:MAG: DJ-1/PfpI family protein [Cyclobacteriaceae bacterium]